MSKSQINQAPVSMEEQILRRQSAPRPTPQAELQNISTQAKADATIYQRMAAPIGRAQILEAQLTLQRYKTGKANLEQRIVDNEQWYKLRHWECMRKKKSKKKTVEPVSGWLFNAIANKHADAMDNFPSPNVLPREEGDKGEAEKLSSILPVILDQNEFEETYDNVWDYKLKAGTGIYGVFWDKSKLNGLGDIAIRKVDILNLFWEPGITDIQASRNVFYVELVDNDLLQSLYPNLQGKLSSSDGSLSQYIYDDTVDTSNKSAVVDWYYKKSDPSGKQVLHFVKYVNDEVLYATENDKRVATTGLYNHGQYPFVFDPLFSVEGSPCGFSYIDVGKSAQEYIDRGNQAIMKNMLANVKPRFYIKSDGAVNEKEYADMDKDFIHVDGNLGQDSILPIVGKPLNEVYVSVINNKIDELKEVTGNRDISTGGTSSGVTAASAIAAMQEAGSKLSRDASKSAYRAFRKVCLLVIELIRQFYTIPRCFRIMGENGAIRFAQYSNAGIVPRPQGAEFGVETGYRQPLFDIEITAQKQSPYSKLSQNELAIQFYNAGFFNPQMADQSLACLDMMDFDRKHMVMQKISSNGTMYQQMMAMQQQMIKMAQIIDQLKGTNMAEQMMSSGQAPAPASAPDAKGVSDSEALGGQPQEASSTRKARQRVAEATNPT